VAVITDGDVLEAIDSEEFEFVPVGIAGGQLMINAAGASAADIDVVLPVVREPFGEDGTVQGFLEMAGLPYVGSGVFAASAALDKEFSKKLFTAAGLPVAPHAVLRPGQDLSEAERERLGLPVRVSGCRSLAPPTVVRDWAALAAAVEDAREEDAKVLVEAAVEGGRVTVTVLEGDDDGPPETRGPSELADQAARAFVALDCSGLVAVDFIVDGDRIYLDRLDTAPELAFPGLDRTALVSRLVKAALKQGTKLR
jgi:D-alanine-D-alanine ligase